MRTIYQEVIQYSQFKDLEFGVKWHHLTINKGYKVGDVIQFTINDASNHFIANDFALYEISCIDKRIDGLVNGYCILALHKMSSVAVIGNQEE